MPAKILQMHVVARSCIKSKEVADTLLNILGQCLASNLNPFIDRFYYNHLSTLLLYSYSGWRNSQHPTSVLIALDHSAPAAPPLIFPL